MRQAVRLRLVNPLVCRKGATSSTGRSLNNPNELDIHRHQAGEQECCREPLPVDLAVYLVRRLIDSQLFQPSRQFLVAQAHPVHLLHYQFLRRFLPRAVRVRLGRSSLERHFAHLCTFALNWPLIFEEARILAQFNRSYMTGLMRAALHVLCRQFL